MKGEMDGKLFVFRQCQQFSFVNNTIKKLFPFCTLNWRVKSYVFRQGKGIKRRNESYIIIINCSLFRNCTEDISR